MSNVRENQCSRNFIDFSSNVQTHMKLNTYVYRLRINAKLFSCMQTNLNVYTFTALLQYVDLNRNRILLLHIILQNFVASITPAEQFSFIKFKLAISLAFGFRRIIIVDIFA